MSNTNETISYKFRSIDSCNMCGSPNDGHRVLGQRLNSSQGKNPRKKSGISVSIMKCNECELIYVNPQPIPYESDYREFIDAWRDEYFEYEEDYFVDEIKQVKELLDFKPGMNVLDVGAGIGKGMRSLQRAGFDAYGIEPSASACRFAYDKFDIPKEKLVCKTIEEAEFSENKFDFVSFGAVLEHLYDPATALKRSLKWVKPGGIIFGEIPNSRYFVAKLINTYNKINLTNFTTHTSPMHAPYHFYEFSIKSFEKFCEQNGCRVAAHKIMVCHTAFVPKIFVPIVDRYMRMTDTGMQLSVFLQKTSD